MVKPYGDHNHSGTRACAESGDNFAMARKRKAANRPKPQVTYTGVYYARRKNGPTIEKLAILASTTPMTINRLQTGKMELTRAWAEKLAPHLRVTAEELLFWEKYHPPPDMHLESGDVPPQEPERKLPQMPRHQIRELETRAGLSGGGLPSIGFAEDGSTYRDVMKPEGWVFPESFVHNELHASPSRLLILETQGDSMFPTIGPGERVIADTSHRSPAPDGVYALREPFGTIVVKRLQLVRSKPPRLKIISDNPNHQVEEVAIDEVDIVGKIVLSLRRF